MHKRDVSVFVCLFVFFTNYLPKIKQKMLPVATCINIVKQVLTVRTLHSLKHC